MYLPKKVSIYKQILTYKYRLKKVLHRVSKFFFDILKYIQKLARYLSDGLVDQSVIPFSPQYMYFRLVYKKIKNLLQNFP